MLLSAVPLVSCSGTTSTTSSGSGTSTTDDEESSGGGDSGSGFEVSGTLSSLSVSDLGLESETAETIGDHDDVSRRYSNPDVDGDGAVDCDGSSSNYTLDFHIRFNMLINGTQAEVDDLVDSFYNENTTTADYTNTGAYVSYPTSF